MKRFLCVILASIITISSLPCLAAQPDWNGPDGEGALPTVCDTGRGYVLYYWYTPGIYYSPDGVTWTDLSDRQWVKDAAGYRYITLGGLGHREFDLVWTGTEYMMRQSLLDDPRSTHQRLGDSPRNSVVTFLDEDFQVIGELAFDGPVTAIRYADGIYYATVNGTETAFSRADWAGPFTDVAPGAWYAPYVAVCMEDGLMEGTGENLFSPERTLTAQECSVLALRLYSLNHGGDGTFAPAPEDFGQITITLDNGFALSGGIGNGCAVQGFWKPTDGWSWAYVDTRFVYHQYLTSEFYTAEDYAWLNTILADNSHAVASYNGTDYPGTMRLFSHTGTEEAFYFQPDDYEAFSAATAPARDFAADPGAWYRDAWYYAYLRQTHDGAQMSGLVAGNGIATRWDLASKLAQAVGELPAINAIEIIPVDDWQEETLLPLYNAGILTGVDDQGTFFPEGTLTRAEAAAMLARILRPELRVVAPTSPPSQGL